MKLTPSEEDAIEDLIERMKGCARTTINLSQVQRVLLRMLREAGNEVLREIRVGPTLIRPKNDDHEAMAAFEAQLRQIIIAAFSKQFCQGS